MAEHFVWFWVLSAATLAAMALLRNPNIRRRLRFSLVALLVLLVMRMLARQAPQIGAFNHEPLVEQLIFALALINTLVTLVFNPWFQDRGPDRSPAIVQD